MEKLKLSGSQPDLYWSCNRYKYWHRYLRILQIPQRTISLDLDCEYQKDL